MRCTYSWSMCRVSGGSSQAQAQAAVTQCAPHVKFHPHALTPCSPYPHLHLLHPGGSIASMLERFGRFSEELARNYTRQLLQGLDYLHGRR